MSVGAGYIGSVTAAELLRAGHRVTVYDNLSRGHRAAVPAGARLVLGDTADAAALAAALDGAGCDAAIHFAAFIEAGESMVDPGRFFANNVANTITLVYALLDAGVERLVFSSSAGVYGEPEMTPIPEEHPLRPVNVYGETKALVERILRWYGERRGLRWVALRYFNAAGATDERGEDHAPESHLIPLILQVPLGRREAITIFGDDYPTRDGSCVRDYVHILDLADAHMLALTQCDRGGGVFNLGNGAGFTNLEVVETARRVAGLPIPAVIGPRRPSDPAALVASSERARTTLGWRPRFASLESIVESAWRWHRAHPHGYGDHQTGARTPA
ncbi:MAG: UDP-glucose 4-epimerase GalE [Dehalococcoidia bacterium]